MIGKEREECEKLIKEFNEIQKHNIFNKSLNFDFNTFLLLKILEELKYKNE